MSSLLRTLPGVQRRLKSDSGRTPSGNQTGVLAEHQSSEPWRDFDRCERLVLTQPGLVSALVTSHRAAVARHPPISHRSTVYSADLESALHYLLRVELATHSTLKGEELKIFKDFVILVTKVTVKRAKNQSAGSMTAV